MIQEGEIAITVYAPPENSQPGSFFKESTSSYQSTNYRSPYGSPVSPVASGPYSAFSSPSNNNRPQLNLSLADNVLNGVNSPLSSPSPRYTSVLDLSSPASPLPSSPNALSSVSLSFDSIKLSDSPQRQTEGLPTEGISTYRDHLSGDTSGLGLFTAGNGFIFGVEDASQSFGSSDRPLSHIGNPDQLESYSLGALDFMASVVDMDALIKDYAMPKSFNIPPMISADSQIISDIAHDSQSQEFHKQEPLHLYSPQSPSPESAWSSPDYQSSTLSPESDITSSQPVTHGSYSEFSPYQFVPTGDGMQRRRGHSVGSADAASVRRGRTHVRAPSSPTPSRRPSPYPQPTSASAIMTTSSDLLAVPPREFGVDADPLRRRHSFTVRSANTLSTPSTPVRSSSENGTYLDPDAVVPAIQPCVRKVASHAGIKASAARRTKEARFGCEFCGQTFTTNHNLKNHMNVHLGYKPFQCPRCSRESTTQSVHARHLKTCKAPDFLTGTTSPVTTNDYNHAS